MGLESRIVSLTTPKNSIENTKKFHFITKNTWDIMQCIHFILGWLVNVE